MENRIAAGKGGFGLSNNQLKIIAMLSMLADHMGMILFPEIRLYPFSFHGGLLFFFHHITVRAHGQPEGESHH